MPNTKSLSLKLSWLVFLFSGLGYSQPTDIFTEPHSVGTKIRFKAPTSTSICTVEMTYKFTGSTPDFANQYHFLRPALFPGAGNVLGPGIEREAIFGEVGARQDINGYVHSTHLLQDADHAHRITCDGSPVTTTFYIPPKPLGLMYTPTYMPNPNKPTWTLQPTWDHNDLTQEFVDPYSGNLIKKGSKPGRHVAEVGHSLDFNEAFTGATGTNWTTPTAAISNSDSNASAEYSAATKDWLHLTATHDVRYYWSIDKIGFRLRICGEGTTTESREYEVAIKLNGDEVADSEIRTGVATQITPGDPCTAAEITIPSDFTSRNFDRWRPANEAQWSMYEIDSGTHSSNSGGIFNPNWGVMIRKKSAAADGKILIQHAQRRITESANLGGFSGGFSEYCSSVKDPQGFYKCMFPANGGAYQLYIVKPETAEVRHLGATTYQSNLGVTWDRANPDRWYTASNTQLISNTYGANGVNYNVEPASGGVSANVTSVVMMANVQSTIINWVAANRPDGFTMKTHFNCGHAGVQSGTTLSDSHLIVECAQGNQDSGKWYAAIKLDPNNKVYTDGTTTTAVVGAYPMFRPAATRWLNGHSYYEHTGRGVSLVGQIWKASNPSGGQHYYIKTLTSMTGSTTTIDIQSDDPDGNSEPYANNDDQVVKRHLQTLEPGDVFANVAGTEIIRVDSKTLQAAGPPKTWRLTLTRGMFSTGAQSYAANTYFQMWPLGGSPVWDFINDPHGVAVKRRIYGSSSHDDHATGRNGSPGYMTGCDGEGVRCSNFDATGQCADTPTNYKTRTSTWTQMNGKRGSKDGQGVEKHCSMGHEEHPDPFQRQSQVDLNPQLGLNWGATGPVGCDVAIWGTPGVSNACWTQRVPTFTDVYATKGQPIDASTSQTVPAQPDWKWTSTFAIAGRIVLRDVSGPNSLVSDATPWVTCNAYKAGECRPDSTAGWRYDVVPGLVVNGCAGGQFAEVTMDLCVGNRAQGLHTINQNFVAAGTHNHEGIEGARQNPPSTNETATVQIIGSAYTRDLSYFMSSPRTIPATGNARLLPDGSWAILPIFIQEIKRVEDEQYGIPGRVRWDWALGKVPKVKKNPKRYDQFLQIPISNGGHPAATTAKMQFGYNSDFYCVGQWADTVWHGRAEKCIKGNQAGLEYDFESDTVTGVACTTGCTINIPAIPYRWVYYRVVYYDGSGNVVATGDTKTVFAE
jgi:hypothetical protein